MTPSNTARWARNTIPATHTCPRRVSLSPSRFTLPGTPLPRGARQRKHDIRQRLYDWNALEPMAALFYQVGSKDDLTSLAGASLAVFLNSMWVEFVLDLEPPKERERLHGAMWGAPLGVCRNGQVDWLTLTARLRRAAGEAGSSADVIMRECQTTTAALRLIASGGYDGRVHRYDDVVVAAYRGVRDAAKRLGFPFGREGHVSDHLEITITVIEG
jgi:hypothetical protein